MRNVIAKTSSKGEAAVKGVRAADTLAVAPVAIVPSDFSQAVIARLNSASKGKKAVEEEVQLVDAVDAQVADEIAAAVEQAVTETQELVALEATPSMGLGQAEPIQLAQSGNSDSNQGLGDFLQGGRGGLIGGAVVGGALILGGGSGSGGTGGDNTFSITLSEANGFDDSKEHPRKPGVFVGGNGMDVPTPDPESGEPANWWSEVEGYGRIVANIPGLDFLFRPNGNPDVGQFSLIIGDFDGERFDRLGGNDSPRNDIAIVWETTNNVNLFHVFTQVGNSLNSITVDGISFDISYVFLPSDVSPNSMMMEVAPTPVIPA